MKSTKSGLAGLATTFLDDSLFGAGWQLLLCSFGDSQLGGARKESNCLVNAEIVHVDFKLPVSRLTSRLRKKRRYDLDSVRTPQFSTPGELWPHPLMAMRFFFRACDHTRTLLRRSHHYIAYADEVIGGGSEGEDPPHLVDSAMPNLPQQRDRLQPSKALFNALPLSLTDGISGMLRCTRINCAPTSSPQVLRYVRCDL